MEETIKQLKELLGSEPIVTHKEIITVKGDVGERGFTGEKGIDGLKGDTGLNGKDGVNGTNGKDGISPIYDEKLLIEKINKRIKIPVPLIVSDFQTNQILYPLAGDKANNTSNTNFGTGQAYFTCLGIADKDFSNAKIVYQGVTAIVTPTSQLWGIYTGNTKIGQSPTLDKKNVVGANFTPVGTSLTANIPCRISKGETIWLAVSQVAGTLGQIRGSQADVIGSGLFCSVAGSLTTLNRTTPTIITSVIIPSVFVELS